MKRALAPLLLVACDAQVDNGYAGDPLATLHATAVGFRPGDVADAAAVRWNPQRGTDLTAGPMAALPLEPIPPSALVVPVPDEPPGDAYFGFAGEPVRIAEGLLFLTSGSNIVATSIDTVLIHVDGEVQSGSLAADYLGGTPRPGFHLGYIRPTVQLTPAQGYLAMACGGGDACRTPRLYRLLIPAADLATELQFFPERAMIERLYREYGHVVRRRAREILQSESEATDAVQDVFLSLLQRPEQLDGVTRITAWLYRATTHYCLNKLRDRRGRIRILGSLRPASSVAARSEALAQVRSLLERLPEPLGEVAVYHHVDGMTYDEIAAMLGCSRRKVGYLLAEIDAIAKQEFAPAAPLWAQERES